MANESFKFGMEGYNDLIKGAYPVAYRRAFQWVTAREMYFYARYLLDFIGGRGHAGIHMLHDPYWTMQAHRHSAYNKYQRDRAERKFSINHYGLKVHSLSYERLKVAQYKSVSLRDIF